mgnify:CR=1 FL=1
MKTPARDAGDDADKRWDRLPDVPTLDELGYAKAQALQGRTPYELVTIASLVERETENVKAHAGYGIGTLVLAAFVTSAPLVLRTWRTDYAS